jgi:hypothetical protein
MRLSKPFGDHHLQDGEIGGLLPDRRFAKDRKK